MASAFSSEKLKNLISCILNGENWDLIQSTYELSFHLCHSRTSWGQERGQNGTREWLGRAVVSGSSTDFFHTWYLIFLLKYICFTILFSGIQHIDSTSLEIILHL